jgi:hypothetical protein
MDRNEFYKDGNKVLTEKEYNVVNGTFEKVENACNDLVCELRTTIGDVMEILFAKRSSTELKTKNYTLINRFGDIGVIKNGDGEEISIDDINSLDTMLDIVAEII